MDDISKNTTGTEAPQLIALSGFWRRLAADLIDIGSILTLSVPVILLMRKPSGAGVYLICLSVSFLYLWLANSRLSSGRSIGKHIMDIRVADRNGRPFGLVRSLVRTVIFFLPLLSPLGLGYLSFKLYTSLWGSYLVWFLLWGPLGMLAYLYVFNRATGQSLHDLATYSFVVRKGAGEKVSAGKFWWPHYLALGLWCALVLGSYYCISMDLISDFTEKPHACLRSKEGVPPFTPGKALRMAEEKMKGVATTADLTWEIKELSFFFNGTGYDLLFLETPKQAREQKQKGDWNYTTQEVPPLTPGKAIRLAQKEVKKRKLNPGVARWKFAFLTLEYDTDFGIWLYNVNFSEVKINTLLRVEGGLGPPPDENILIRMDGTILSEEEIKERFKKQLANLSCSGISIDGVPAPPPKPQLRRHRITIQMDDSPQERERAQVF